MIVQQKQIRKRISVTHTFCVCTNVRCIYIRISTPDELHRQMCYHRKCARKLNGLRPSLSFLHMSTTSTSQTNKNVMYCGQHCYPKCQLISMQTNLANRQQYLLHVVSKPMHFYVHTNVFIFRFTCRHLEHRLSIGCILHTDFSCWTCRCRLNALYTGASEIRILLQFKYYYVRIQMFASVFYNFLLSFGRILLHDDVALKRSTFIITWKRGCVRGRNIFHNIKQNEIACIQRISKDKIHFIPSFSFLNSRLSASHITTH